MNAQSRARGNPNDEVRGKILQYFYDRNAKATSRFGKKGSAVRVSDVKRELKGLHGLTQQQVMSNLTYLIDRNWVKTFDQEKQVQTRGGTTVPSSVTFYEITAVGIEKIEGESEFTPPNRFPGINISAIGNSVVTLGDGNVVHIQYRQLHSVLNDLQIALARSSLGDEEKLSLAADIETLKTQLAKETPNRSIIAQVWAGIEKTATAAGLTEFVLAVAPHIQNLIG